MNDGTPQGVDTVPTHDIDIGGADGGRAWSVVIIAAREDPQTLCSVIDAALEAARGHPAVVDVLVNGNQDLSLKAASFIASKARRSGPSARIRIWDIPLRDKAHAWNQYVHQIWPGSDCAFFLDGYAQVMPDAFGYLSETLSEWPAALASTAGYRANDRRQGSPTPGALSGNMHALRGSTVSALRERGIRLPLGYYWVDGLTGGILNYRFDPARHSWSPDNIVRNPQASWTTRQKSPWRIQDLRDQYNRMKRQARGRVENLAVRDHLTVRRDSPANFPATARQLFVDWMRNHPFRMAWFAMKHPLVLDAIWQLRRPQDWSKKDLPPVLVATVEV
jgi:hypothetical protein